jgi:hypothetical protein
VCWSPHCLRCVLLYHYSLSMYHSRSATLSWPHHTFCCQATSVYAAFFYLIRKTLCLANSCSPYSPSYFIPTHLDTWFSKLPQHFASTYILFFIYVVIICFSPLFLLLGQIFILSIKIRSSSSSYTQDHSFPFSLPIRILYLLKWLYCEERWEILVLDTGLKISFS